MIVIPTYMPPFLRSDHR